MQVEKTRFRFQEVCNRDNEIPPASFAGEPESGFLCFLGFVRPMNESCGIKSEGNYL